MLLKGERLLVTPPLQSPSPHPKKGTGQGQAGYLWEELSNTPAELSCVVSNFCW